MPLPFRTESWIWYALGVFVVVCRTLSRLMLFKTAKKLQIDDFLMFVVLSTDTVLVVAINLVHDTSSNLLAPGEDVSNFSPQQRADKIYGSKLVVVVEQMQCGTVWLIKVCLLIMYMRLTNHLPAKRLVKLLAAYTAVGFVVMEILYLGVWCRPFHNYWALPTPNSQCSAATDHLIVNAVFNLSSDVVMLSIALSLFIRSRLPLDRKLILCGIFGLGIFVILSAVLNKYYSFTHPYGYEWTYWYVRESSTAILVANLPFIWTLLRRIFKLKAFAEASTGSDVPWHSPRSAAGRHWMPAASMAGVRSQDHGSLALRGDSPHSPYSPLGDSLHTHPALEFPQVAAQLDSRPHWREQGVYGRTELSDLAIEQGQTGSEYGMGVSPTEETWATTVRHSDSGSGTPAGWSRRIRDEEAQHAIQEDLNVQYSDLDDANDNEPDPHRYGSQ